MLHYGFGQSEANPDNLEVFLKALQRLRGKVGSVAAQLSLTEVYDTFYGIYNHEHQNAHPLATVMCHPKETLGDYTPLHQRYLDYVTHDIRRYFGLSVEEYMDHPVEFVELMNKISMKMIQRENEQAQDIDEGVKKAQRKAQHTQHNQK